jgi:NAD+ diphosphatase
MDLNFCPVCGAKLRTKALPHEAAALYCGQCAEYRFPLFSAAVAAVVLDADGENMILIRQYGEIDPVLVAGYIDKGERAEDAVVREVREELGMTVRKLSFLRSHYYAPSETLMLLYAVTVTEKAADPNWEVDSWAWVPVECALAQVKPGGLAEKFLLDFEEYRKEKCPGEIGL